jgi:hypothetical protein
MRPLRYLALSATIALGALAASAPLAISAAGAQTKSCFRAMEWRGSASGGPHDLYIRVGMHDIWHLGMAHECPGAQFPGPVSLTDVVTNSNEICTGVDLQITVRPRGSENYTHCIVTSMEKLTPDQAKALPKKAIPD